MCDICCLDFNDFHRKKVECLKCNKSSCRKCVKQFILGSIRFARCMYCDTEWDFDFLNEMMTKNFVSKDYKEHIKNVWVDREKSFIPETQPFAEYEEKFEKIENTLSELMSRKSYLLRNWADFEEGSELNDLHSKIRKARKERRKLMENRPFLTKKEDKKERRQFICPCPKEGCRGFVDTKWHCGMCNSNVCKDCREVMNETSHVSASHVCNPDTVSTIKALSEDTKPCPKCFIPIHKTFGCDQMFCVECKTLFSWNTGEIETGIGHNPHYFEFLRSTGRAEQLCRDGDQNYRVYNGLYRFRGDDYDKYSSMLMFRGELVHKVDRLRRDVQSDPRQITLKIRVSYIRGLIDEKKFCTDIYRKMKKHYYDTELFTLYNTLSNVITDILLFTLDTSDVNKGLNEFLEYINYHNKQLSNISKKYGYTVSENVQRFISGEFGFGRNAIH